MCRVCGDVIESDDVANSDGAGHWVHVECEPTDERKD
jgi:hypothetical protein